MILYRAPRCLPMIVDVVDCAESTDANAVHGSVATTTERLRNVRRACEPNFIHMYVRRHGVTRIHRRNVI